MNGTYYQNPTFPTATSNNYQDTIVPVGNELSMEQSYIENILRLNIKNKGKYSCGEIGLPMTESKMVLPCGIFAKWEKN